MATKKKKEAPKEPLLKISEFSLLAGVSMHTLQIWDRMGYLAPICRGPGGGRMYYASQAEEARALFGRIKKPLERAPRWSVTPYERKVAPVAKAAKRASAR